MQTNSFVEKVKRDISIENYVSRYIKLKRQGKRAIGLCPFHQEKTPSFSISTDLQLYHCFGCGRSGDIFKFVMEYDRVDFQKAKEILSEYSGIPLQESGQSSRDFQEKNELIEINTKVNEYFLKNLFSEHGKQARDYLSFRKIPDSMILSFQLGFSLPGFDNLQKDILELREVTNALKLGLLKENQSRRGQYYDFFRDRIMFPIKDVNNKVVGFGGRVFKKDSEEAKYLNSAASPIYDKGKMFFNLNQAANSIRKSRQAILVEGYLDVIGLTSKSFDNVVAPLGTALTNQQVRILKNYADKIIIMLDGDNAGRKAAWKASHLCLQEGLNAEVVILENGIDPFDLSVSHSKMEIEDILSRSISMSEFLLKETLMNANKDSGPEIKKRAIDSLFEFIKSLQKESDREAYLKEGSKLIGISYSSLFADFKNGSGFSLSSPKVDNKQGVALREKVIPRPAAQCEKRLLSFLVLYSELMEFAEELNGTEFIDPESALLWEYIYSRFINGEQVNADAIINGDIPETVIRSIMPYFMEQTESDELERKTVFVRLMKNQKIFVKEQEMNELSLSLNSPGNVDAKNFSRLMQLKNEIESLRNEIREL